MVQKGVFVLKTDVKKKNEGFEKNKKSGFLTFIFARMSSLYNDVL